MIRVPAPERFAIHKIILSQRRPSGIAKTGRQRKVLGIDLTFHEPVLRYDSLRSKSDDERVAAVSRNRSKIEAMLREKYLNWPIEDSDALILKTSDISDSRLRR